MTFDPNIATMLVETARRDANGFKGRFEFQPEHTEDHGIGNIGDFVDVDDRIVYIPTEDASDEETYVIAGPIDPNVGEPIARMLNNVGPLGEQLEGAMVQIARLTDDLNVSGPDSACCRARERAEAALANIKASYDETIELVERLRAKADTLEQRLSAPIPLRLPCPSCHEIHVDEALADKPHHTHACQSCGHVWRPAIVNTVGVRFLPGFKDETPAPRKFERKNPDPDAGLLYETCANCDKHIRHHYGLGEYRCDPKEKL